MTSLNRSRGVVPQSEERLLISSPFSGRRRGLERSFKTVFAGDPRRRTGQVRTCGI
jgi:hypothetical protein